MRNFTEKLVKSVPVSIILPVVLTVLLFVMTIFLLILPLLEAKLMEGKRETIRELTESAWSTLSIYAEKEENKQITREHAQAQAVEHLRQLRYGPELKDYFWINDMHPHIIMHPYRTDLEGKDISDLTDPNGKRLFAECVKIVKNSGAGYVDYEWQWKDEPDRIVPKISFVKGFEPWGWIIGTGIYVEDVRAEIAAITRKLTLVCLGILLIIMGLSSYIIWRGVVVTKEKKRAQDQAKMRQEQLFQAAKMVSLGTLVSGVAHEINNPITSILLNMPTLQKIWDSVLPVTDEYFKANKDFQVGPVSYPHIRERMPLLLSNIADGARRVRDIVTDLKDFARENPPEMSDDVDVNKVVRKASGLVSNLIKKSTDHFSIDCKENLPAFRGNTQRTEQVVINLLVNACQALRDSSEPIRITTGYNAESGCTIIEIHDKGTGIPPEVLQRIKDPFFTTKRDTGGTGLGLAISDRIVQDHGGTLEFESSAEGTTVRICFPADKKQEAISDRQ
ncbi:MAG: GHKL domain-containing protein [Desulfobacterales bacterium]|nr:GHKL domain-containing protein [Desulfobacterales bacterium]